MAFTARSPRRNLSTASMPKPPRHFLTLRDLPTEEVLGLLKKAMDIKNAVKTGQPPSPAPLNGHTLAMIFSKRSTRTRVSSESGWAWYGGHAMYLNPQDIQIGSGEPMQDTAIVISSMVDGILARLGGHEEIETLAKHSSVPVINALTAKFHPLQVDFSFPLGGSDSIATVPYSTDPRRPPHFI
jgi:ornithine carbamoyltransferase